MNAHDKEGIRTARLFRNGRSQAVRIPREFEFEGEEVLVRKNGEGELVISAKKAGKISPILDWLAKNGPIDDFPGDPGYDDLLPLDDVKI